MAGSPAANLRHRRGPMWDGGGRTRPQMWERPLTLRDCTHRHVHSVFCWGGRPAGDRHKLRDTRLPKFYSGAEGSSTQQGIPRRLGGKSPTNKAAGRLGLEVQRSWEVAPNLGEALKMLARARRAGERTRRSKTARGDETPRVVDRRGGAAHGCHKIEGHGGARDADVASTERFRHHSGGKPATMARRRIEVSGQSC